jgi:hypothetical protein
MNRFAICTIVSLVVATVGVASASAQSTEPVVAQKDPGTAQLLSLIGTAIPLGLYAWGATGKENDTLLAVGATGMMIGPSLGHYYANRRLGTPGLAARLAGTGVGLLGVAMLVAGGVACSNVIGPSSENCDDGSESAKVVMAAGAGLFIGGAIYDIATAGRAARRENARQMSLRPLFQPGAPGQTSAYGLSLDGTF